MSKPTFDEVANAFTFDLSQIEKEEIYDKVSEAYEDGWNKGYDGGYKDGEQKGLDDAIEDFEEPEVNEEQIGVAYAVEAFDSCTSFEEFRAKYLEIVRLNLSYTPPLGLYKAEQHKIPFAK